MTHDLLKLTDLSSVFVAKAPLHKATVMPEWNRNDRVEHDGTVYFYAVPCGTNAEDFAALASAAFGVDVPPQDVLLWDDHFVVEVQ